MREVDNRASTPGRRPASVVGVAWTRRPTPPTSSTAESSRTAATRPLNVAITQQLLHLCVLPDTRPPDTATRSASPEHLYERTR